jgi:hypothetical protein
LLTDEPELRKKAKDKTSSGGVRLAAAALIKRIRRATTTSAMRTGFTSAARATTAGFTDIPPEAYDTFAPCEVLDAANPFWDFSLDSEVSDDPALPSCDASPGL